MRAKVGMKDCLKYLGEKGKRDDKEVRQVRLTSLFDLSNHIHSFTVALMYEYAYPCTIHKGIIIYLSKRQLL